MPGGEEEYSTSRTFTYLTRVGALVSRMNKVYAKIKKKKDWGLDPDFVQLNPALNAWFNDLPPDLTISYPADGSPPWLPSPIVGNIHSYYYLATILLHRPQLTFLNPATSYREWKHHMMLCYSSSKLLCRLQEAIYQTWGLTGLQSMQRGISFTVYCILSCIVHHLVRLHVHTTPELSSRRRQCFTGCHHVSRP